MRQKPEFAPSTSLLYGCALTALFTLEFGGLAAAADAPPAAGQVQEVVVTAQKRVENVQNVPASVQVVSGKTLQLQNIVSLDTLSETTPSIHVVASSGSNDLAIRGISTGKGATFDQSVGTFVDDVYFGRSRSTVGTFLDLQDVEVLKGPQSTYFGNNAIAGAFNIVTQKPGNTFDAEARALYGQYGEYAVEAETGGPISDTLGVRIAAIADGQNGWLKDLNYNSGVPKENGYGGRLTLVFKPTNNFDATLKVDGEKSTNFGALGVQMTNCPPPAPFKASLFCSVALGLNEPTGLNNNSFDSNPEGTTYTLGEGELTANYRAFGQTFTSVTDFYSQHYTLGLDADLTPESLLNLYVPENYNQFSQEFRVTSSADQRLRYIAGAYFQVDHLSQDGGGINYFLENGAFSGIPLLAPYVPIGSGSDLSQNEHLYALFGSLSWSVTDQLVITGGLRAVSDTKSMSDNSWYGTTAQAYGGVVPAPAAVQTFLGKVLGAVGSTGGSRTDQALLPSANVEYKFNPDEMLYFRYDHGFLAGGFAPAAENGAFVANPFAPETVNAYEGGFKSKLFDNRVLLNVDAFLSDYTNLQVSQTLENGPTFVNITTNAAQSTTRGVELEAQWFATRQLNFSANATYDDAHFVNYQNVTNTQFQAFCHGAANFSNSYCLAAFGPTGAPATQNLSGRPTPYAPKWSGSLSATYTTSVLDGFTLTAGATLGFSSGYLPNQGTDDPLNYIRAWTRLDARVSLASPDGHWAIDVIGKNLTNQVITENTFSLPSSSGSTASVKEEPENVSVQLRYKW